MFRVSKRLDYGLQLLLALARESENQPLATALLAERLDIPLPFLHQIGHVLMQAGLIKALPGPKGGIKLSRSPEMITILNVVEALEGAINLNPEPDSRFKMNTVSKAHPTQIWEDLQLRIESYLSSISLVDVLETGSVSIKIDIENELVCPER